jgi:hypothetical protein
MRRIVAIVAVAGVALSGAACTDSKRARNAATWGDQPADITCWTYGTENFRGRSTGKVEYDEGGRVSFVDASNDRYTTVEGDCRVVYMSEAKADAPPAPVAPVAPPAPAPVAPVG